MTTEDNKPDPAQHGREPDYDRLAAEMMQQWQQQFARPVAGPEVAEAMSKSGTLAQSMLEMGQVLWQGWLQPKPAGDTTGDAAPQDKPDASGNASATDPAYAAGNADASFHTAADKRDAAAAAAGIAGPAAGSGASLQPDATPAASMASVALCAELARRLDLLSQRVAGLERQLEQQLANK